MTFHIEFYHQSKNFEVRSETISELKSLPEAGLVRGGSNPTLTRGVSNSSEKETPTNPEILSCIASRVTQQRPRKLLRLCVLFTAVAFVLTSMTMGGLVVFVHPSWYLCLVAWIFSLIPLLTSIPACRTGKCPLIAGVAISCLCNVCATIAVVCVVMTDISNAAGRVDRCSSHPDDADCFDTEYERYLTANRAIATALVTTYGMINIVSNGIPMVYAFFLYRRCRKQPRNWLVSGPKFRATQTRSVSTSASSV